MARREPELGTLPRGRRGARSGVRDGIFRPRAGAGSAAEGGGGGGNRKLVVGLVVLVLFVGGAFLVLPSVMGGVFRAMAEQNPDWLRVPFVADSVRGDMDERVDQPAGSDPTPVEFVVQSGSSSRQITDELAARELVTDRLAFSFVLIEEGLGGRLQAGTHNLNRTMSPREVAEELASAPVPAVARVTVSLRDGLRLEQITAYLQTLGLELDIEQFYALATAPTDALREEYEWLRVVPAGRSLEGFLGAGIFEVDRETTADEMVRILLDRWASSGAGDLIAEAEGDGRNFYEIITLAAIVEREATLPEEAPLIAGVFQNRLDGLNNGNRLLNADPTVVYAKDAIMLRQLPITEWPTYTFWTYDGLNDIANFTVPPDLAGYHSWRTRGLPPGPICSPSLASIEAALRPDTDDGYLYFVAKGDGSNSHAFAKTYEDHLRNIDEIRNRTPEPTL
jgi:UPF0755 protein